MAFKRKRVFAPRFTKRKRTGKFIRRRRGRNSSSYSTKAGAAVSLPYKARRISRRLWNKKLWDSTLQKQHYRSNGALSGAITTAASQGQVSITGAQAMDNGVSVFWTAAGGAIEANAGAGVPTFEGDVIIRGGIVGFKLFNESTTIPAQCKVYLIKMAPRPSLANIPVAANVGWDPTLVPEFTKDVGKVIFMKEFQLEALAEMSVERRLSIMKIDPESWSTDAQRFYWLFVCGDPQTVTTVTLRVVTYFNISFTADVSAP